MMFKVGRVALDVGDGEGLMNDELSKCLENMMVLTNQRTSLISTFGWTITDGGGV